MVSQNEVNDADGGFFSACCAHSEQINVYFLIQLTSSCLKSTLAGQMTGFSEKHYKVRRITPSGKLAEDDIFLLGVGLSRGMILRPFSDGKDNIVEKLNNS